MSAHSNWCWGNKLVLAFKTYLIWFDFIQHSYTGIPCDISSSWVEETYIQHNASNTYEVEIQVIYYQGFDH